MNILHVIRTMNPAWGGPVEGIKNLALQALAQGHSLEVTCLDEPHAPWLRNSRVRINAIGPAKCGRFGYSRNLDHWLASYIREFDVVISNGIWMYFSAAVRRASRRANVPYYVFTHGALDPWFKRYRVKHIKKQIYWSLVEYKVIRDAAAVLFTTSEELVVSNNAFRPYVCNPRVVGYGIEDPLVAGSPCQLQFRKALPQLGARPFLLFLARVQEKKGIDLLLQSIARNIHNYRNHAFVIAGPGKDSYVSHLKMMAAELGLTDQIIWPGPLYGELKWAAIRNADAYVLPSHQENFGISVVEALACGTPVLITNKVNIWREIVADGGGLAENDDLEGASRLLELWTAMSLEERATMRERARQCFLNHFNIRAISNNLFNVLAQFSQERRRPL
jgi:glycosyltransferase involved in cell wall biosynthesis